MNAIEKKMEELIKLQEITISYFLKYSGEAERITRFMNSIKTAKSELAQLKEQESKASEINAEQIVEENFKGLDSLIDDEDICQWYKQLIVTCMQEYAELKCKEQQNIK